MRDVEAAIAFALMLIAIGMLVQTVRFWSAHGLTYFVPWAVVAITAGQWIIVGLALARGAYVSAGSSAIPALLGLTILALKARAHLRTKRRWRSRVR